MQGRVNIRGKNPGAEASWCTAGNSASEDKLDTAGAAQVNVVAYDFLEELMPGKGAVEDLGQADLELEDREFMVIACPPVFGGRWLGQDRHPAVEEGLDVGGAELVTDILHSGSIRSAKQAVNRER